MFYRLIAPKHPLAATSSRDRLLGNGTTVDDVADACRAAITAFLHGSRDGWTSFDLRRWRLGPCERALVASHLDVPIPTLPPPPPSSAELIAEVTDARVRALELIVRCKFHPSSRFAQAMIDIGVVERVHDASGAVGWAPTPRAGLKLAERIATFIVADCLSRPRDYERIAIHGDDVAFVEHDETRLTG